MNIFKLKSIAEVMEHTGGHSGLKKSLGVFDLFLMGLGAIIGTGIFVLTGEAAVTLAGPAVVISYAIAGVTAIFIALAYTEIASMVPCSGGAYSYSFIAFGEIVAWIVSWMLALYFTLSATTVAAGWSGYMVAMLREGGIVLPVEFTTIPANGGIINLPAVLVSLFVTGILVKGTKESATFNNICVLTKILSIALFVYVAAPHFDTQHWFAHNHPFKDVTLSSSFMPFGLNGVITGAALVFFAYNGFDALATAAEECKNPKRDITIAILGSLLVCMSLYMLVAGLLVGIVPFHTIDIQSPLASALSHGGHRIASSLISAGAVIGMMSVMLLQIFAFSRILAATARDGLLPAVLGKIHPKYNTPHIATLSIGIVVSLIAGFCPIGLMGILSSVGALFTFTVVCLAMLMLRRRYPNFARPFKCPLVYVVAPLAVILCLSLLESTIEKVGFYVLIWLGVGFAFYFLYKKSKTRARIQ